MAVRLYKRSQNVKDIEPEEVARALEETHTTPEQAEEIYKLTSLPSVKEQFVIPPMMREKTPEDPFTRRAKTGVGFKIRPERRW